MSTTIRVEDTLETNSARLLHGTKINKPDSAGEFFAEVKRSLEQRHPGLGSSVPRVPTARDTRRLPLSRFPYMIVYRKRTSNSRVLPSLIIALNQDTGLLDDKVLILCEANAYGDQPLLQNELYIANLAIGSSGSFS